MEKISLIFFRTLRISTNSTTKIIGFIIGIFFISGSSIVPPILEVSTGDFSSSIINIFLGVRIIITLIIAFAVGRGITKDINKGYLKNIFTNSFTKQQYFLGTILFWSTVIFISTVLSFAITMGIWTDKSTDFPQGLVWIMIMFIVMFIFLVPQLVFWFAMLIIFFSFRVGKEHKIQNLIISFAIGVLLILIVLMIILTKVNWIHYIVMLIPFVNLIYSVPQETSRQPIEYWWVYIIDITYLFATVTAMILTQKNKWFKINGQFSNKYF